MAIDLASVTRRIWHGYVNDKRNEPQRVAPASIRCVERLLRARRPSLVVVGGEGKDLFRKKTHPEYKGKRPPMPPELERAELAVKNALTVAGIAPWCVRGLEADDVLHGAVLRGIELGVPVVVVTADKDADQLVSDVHHVVVWKGEGDAHDEAAVIAEWGVEPSRIPEILALAGDTTDGIPGVFGWGVKTSAQILRSVGDRNLERLLSDGGSFWVPTKWRKKFTDNLETIRMSYDLAKLRGKWLVTHASFVVTPVDPIAVADVLADEAERLYQATFQRPTY
jgi:DNA polymerase-1